jgi:hypothetical protein
MTVDLIPREQNNIADQLARKARGKAPVGSENLIGAVTGA